ncbi:MAG: response regulator transcription factor [Candidatus Saccharibacteria bacterium]
MSKTLLIVEDDERMRKLISFYFSSENFNIIEAENGEEAISLFGTHKVDLVILDVMMPLLDGFSVCKALRAVSRVPLIILTARSDEDDKLTGFELGADDYVTKPFSPRVLVARAKALLKRADPAFGDQAVIEIGDLHIDNQASEVRLGENLILFSPKEYELLLYMVENQGHALSRQQILDHVWGFDYSGELRTVDTHIWRLREKLGDTGELISTVRGRGYKFEVRK